MMFFHVVFIDYDDDDKNIKLFSTHTRYTKVCCNNNKWTLQAKTSRNISLILTLVNLILSTPTLYLFENRTDRNLCHIRRELIPNKLVIAYYRYLAPPLIEER